MLLLVHLIEQGARVDLLWLLTLAAGRKWLRSTGAHALTCWPQGLFFGNARLPVGIIIMFNGKVGHKGPRQPHGQGITIQNNFNVSTIMNDSELGVGIA